MVKKILFITLSNIGDVILTLPALDSLKAKYPGARITVVVGPRASQLFEASVAADRVIIFDKHSPLREKIKLFNRLKRERFDITIDLRNTLLGFLCGSKSRFLPASIPAHMMQRHLFRAGLAAPGAKAGKCLRISPKDQAYIDAILDAHHIKAEDKIVVIAAGARSHIKRWAKEKFTRLIPELVKQFGVRVILAGDKDDIPVNKFITDNLSCGVVDLTAKTTLSQLACLLKKAELVITNDSAILHMASYLDRPVVALFGPTDEERYGPWSGNFAVTKKELACRPCVKAQCRFGHLQCMQLIKVEDVLKAAKSILDTEYGIRNTDDGHKFKRILIVRTDRIGDVLLSTPVIRAIRSACPDSYIAMMVGPYAKDIVEGNPCLDEVILYDKGGKHRGALASMKFALRLKKKRFDLALVLHPANRVHLLTFFAAIRRRVGYNRKLGFLLTDKLEHTKQSGQKHESEYNLDLVRHLGIEPQDKSLFMPVDPKSEKWVEDILKHEGIGEHDKLLAIHPGASCPSKIWPNERFAEVADSLSGKYGFKVLVLAGPKDIALARKVIGYMGQPVVDLAGKTSVSQLASILKRCRLFISNDSGPVHIASALDIPVISIFGRSQKGLSPVRWGPLGSKGRVAHKTVGCVECLAHNCPKGFVCLKAVTVDYVLNLADAVLKESG